MAKVDWGSHRKHADEFLGLVLRRIIETEEQPGSLRVAMMTS